MARRLHLFVWILYLALSVGGRYFDHNLPPLPGEFYSGYVEEIITKEEPGLNDTTTTVSLSWVRKEPAICSCIDYMCYFVLHVDCI